MAVRLRLTRMGKKKQPFYRIVALDSRTQRDGRYLDRIGHYNPMRDPPEVQIDAERALKWLMNGAIPSDTVKSLFRQQGIMFRFHLMKSGLDEAQIQEEVKKWEILQIERQKRLEAKWAQEQREQETVEEEVPPSEEPETETEVKAEVKTEAEAKAEAETEESGGSASEEEGQEEKEE